MVALAGGSATMLEAIGPAPAELGSVGAASGSASAPVTVCAPKL
jgi:hypothetical protein